jgi:hypothetical protein
MGQDSRNTHPPLTVSLQFGIRHIKLKAQMLSSESHTGRISGVHWLT